MHRFFLPPEAISQGQVRFPPPVARQIAHVLRLRPGEIVAVLDGQGLLHEVTLQHVARDEVSGKITATREASGEPSTAVTLYMALIKGERMEWAIQKATELGVARIVPMVTERTVIREARLSEARLARWRRIAQEAAEQCERARVPAIAEPMAFAEACVDAAGADLAAIAWAREARLTLDQVMAGREVSSLALLIGPEGGFSPEELVTACGHGMIPFTLGPRILRAETAAVVALALAMQALGELQPTA